GAGADEAPPGTWHLAPSLARGTRVWRRKRACDPAARARRGAAAGGGLRWGRTLRRDDAEDSVGSAVRGPRRRHGAAAAVGPDGLRPLHRLAPGRQEVRQLARPGPA